MLLNLPIILSRISQKCYLLFSNIILKIPDVLLSPVTVLILKILASVYMQISIAMYVTLIS